MADQYYDDDDDDMTQDEGPSALRKALKKAEKERKELQAELASLRDAQRSRSVKDVLETAGVNPKIAAFIPKDIVEPSQVTTWLAEYGDVFGFAQQSKTEDSVPNENAQAQKRMDETTSTASTPSGIEDLDARLRSANSLEELDQIVFGQTRGR